MEHYEIGDGPISVEAALQGIRDPACGGEVVFLGTVRNEFEGRPSRGLIYQAYQPLAEQEMARIGQELVHEFGVRHVVMVHRTGALELGSVSVLVAASAPHRDAAFRAVAAGIDRLKARVPIWKKEIWDDGTAGWHFDPTATTN